MTTVQFLQSVLDWLLADPSHIVVAASAIAALTPCPDPSTLAGKLYRVIDILALNILRAKEGGAPPMLASLPASSSPVPQPVPEAAKAKQAGFARGLAPQAILILIGAAGLAALGGCAAAQGAFTTANAQAMQASMGVGRDQLLVGKEMICAAPYIVVADAMADDAALGSAVPALCPATKSVPVPIPPPSPAGAAR
jgi:hypothetical protein